MKSLSRLYNFLPLILVLFIFGCADSRKEAEESSFKNGFSRQIVKGGGFALTTYRKITDSKKPFVFYIEGDGFLGGRGYISSDPTPRDLMLLNLAFLDKRPNVVYIARPCQFTDPESDPKCSGTYWLDKRMSEEVIFSVNEVINKTNISGEKFSLVGFSGGGGVAVLIAARNEKVKDVLTVAANLDHEAFTDFHSKIRSVSPMDGSLNPINFAFKVRNVPQLHLAGGKDERVPVSITEKYVKACSSSCVKSKIFPKNTHSSGWKELWPEILNISINCE